MKTTRLIKLRRRLWFSFLTVLAFIASLCLAWTPKLSVLAQAPITQIITQRQLDPYQPEQKGQKLYLNGQFESAIVTWQQAAQGYYAQGKLLSQARVLSNLCLGYQKLGQWQSAEEAIAQSLKLLESQVNQNSYLNVLAQTLNNQGTLQLASGKPQQALETWQQATQTYTQAEHLEGVLRSQINQAQAMQTLGFYRRALQQLELVNQNLQPLPDSPLKVVALRNWGNLLRLVGKTEQSQQILEQSLVIARSLSSPQEIGTTLLSLGNTAFANQDHESALAFYQQGLTLSISLSTKIQLQLAQLRVFLEQENWLAAYQLFPTINANLDSLPLSHSHIAARINFARSLLKFKQLQITNESKLTWESIAQLLATAVQQSEQLGDQRNLTYALGSLGTVYEHTQQWLTAQELTEQALFKAQVMKAPEIAYLWQWQLGRLHQAQHHQKRSISAYSESIKTLKSLRSDLAATNSEVQFSFTESVEPVYRQLVSILLKSEPGKSVSQEHLAQARDVIESLQLAELDNFLQEACLDTETVKIDEVDSQAAVIYPIILDDRLEVIMSLPEQPLRHHTTFLSRNELESTIRQLRGGLVIRSRRDYRVPSQQLYNWLIRPMVAELETSGVKTLVFVPDGALRNIPMATLSDGEHFLVENYNIALTPGLQLLDPQPLKQIQLKTLAAGLTKERQGFTPLDNVASELEGIKDNIPSQVLLDQQFTNQSLQQAIESDPFNIIHIATHGQFSSNLADTFLLTWDDRISINQLDEVLQVSSHNNTKNVELLVLSACETATGDQRAALGLAGMAVRAGARSTLATLWSVNDRATAEFMGKFYQGIGLQKITKAEAIRQGQLELLNNPIYRHPYYWSPYILVGNWL